MKHYTVTYAAELSSSELVKSSNRFWIAFALVVAVLIVIL